MIDTNTIEIARQAAEGAAAFGQVLAAKASSIVDCLRDGRDNVAMLEIALLVDDLEHFLTFFVLVDELLPPGESAEMRAYREKLLNLLEGIDPILANRDFVELADVLEADLSPLLRSYQTIDPSVQTALAA